MHWLLWAAPSRAHLIHTPPHDHTAAAVTWADGHNPVPTHQHQHRTPHDPRQGVHVHSTGTGAQAYTANRVWVDRTVLTRVAGTDHLENEFAHGHQVTAARYRIRPAVAGGDITAAEAAAWNAGASDRAFDAFNGIGTQDGWLDVGNATGASNWHNTDNTSMAPAAGGLPWVSRVNWTRVTTAPFELEIIYGEANDNCNGENVGCAHVVAPSTGHQPQMIITMDDDYDWYYGVSTDTAVEPDKIDFATVMLHETGHVIGFGHFGSIAAGQIMSAENQPVRKDPGGIIHRIDADAVHGVLDLYSIAVPEPGAMLLVAAARVSCLRRRRKR
jgi:hypothetical protein